MKIIVNGETRETESATVLDLLKSLTVHPKTVVVELNGEIVSRTEYEVCCLNEYDTLEIVQMMAGG